MNVNKVVLAGRITKDPELKQTQSGVSVCSFTVATNETYRDKDGVKKQNASYVDCTAINKVGETINKYFSKGSEIFVDGKLKLNVWQDKTGAKRQKLYVLVNEFQFVGNDKKENAPQADAQSYDDGDDTPF